MQHYIPMKFLAQQSVTLSPWFRRSFLAFSRILGLLCFFMFRIVKEFSPTMRMEFSNFGHCTVRNICRNNLILVTQPPCELATVEAVEDIYFFWLYFWGFYSAITVCWEGLDSNSGLLICSRKNHILETCDVSSLIRSIESWASCHSPGKRGWTSFHVWQDVQVEARVDTKSGTGTYGWFHVT
jgi:hypothetical protein